MNSETAERFEVWFKRIDHQMQNKKLAALEGRFSTMEEAAACVEGMRGRPNVVPNSPWIRDTWKDQGHPSASG